MNEILQWFQERFDEILRALDPLWAIQQAASFIASMLPAPDPDTLEALRNLPVLVSFFLEYISWLDYFIDLRFYIFTLTLAFGTEALLLAFRVWRTARSTLT